MVFKIRHFKTYNYIDLIDCDMWVLRDFLLLTEKNNITSLCNHRITFIHKVNDRDCPILEISSLTFDCVIHLARHFVRRTV